MIQVLHYYCKPRRADIFNNIAYQKGISNQVQTKYLDISDIVKELSNKNHVDCIAIDEDLFGTFDEAEEIKSKIEVLKYVCENTEILIIAPDRTQDDEIIQILRRTGLADCIITKDLMNQFEDVVTRYFDGEHENKKETEIVSKTADISLSEINRDIPKEPVMEDVAEDAVPEAAYQHEKLENAEISEEIADKKSIASGVSEFLREKLRNVEKRDEPEEQSYKPDNEMAIEDDKMITVGICGLQPHIGVTHHALAMAQAMSKLYKHVCYQECSTHDAYRVLQKSSIASAKQGYIRIMNVDIFDRNADISVLDKYNIRIMDFGYINECKQEDLFNTDIPIVICGVKDWEIENFIGAYNLGVLDKANVLINFFPEKEQSAFASTFHDLKIFFADYAPEVFEPERNMEIYTNIIKNI